MLTAAIAFTDDLDGGTCESAAGITLVNDSIANIDAQGAKISKALGSTAAGICQHTPRYRLFKIQRAARIQDTDFARSSKKCYPEPSSNGYGCTS